MRPWRYGKFFIETSTIIITLNFYLQFNIAIYSLEGIFCSMQVESGFGKDRKIF